jgi:predicted nucleic acid-binding protein
LKLFVLDCSITMSWCFEDEMDHKAMTVLDRLSSEGAVVPAIWPVEVANVLAVAQRRRRISRADAERFLALLDDLPISIDVETTASNTFRFAVELGISSYGAAYIELAVRRGIQFATRDSKLAAAARSIGIVLMV